MESKEPTAPEGDPQDGGIVDDSKLLFSQYINPKLIHILDQEEDKTAEGEEPEEKEYLGDE